MKIFTIIVLILLSDLGLAGSKAEPLLPSEFLCSGIVSKTLYLVENSDILSIEHLAVEIQYKRTITPGAKNPTNNSILLQQDTLVLGTGSLVPIQPPKEAPSPTNNIANIILENPLSHTLSGTLSRLTVGGLQKADKSVWIHLQLKEYRGVLATNNSNPLAFYQGDLKCLPSQ